MSGNAEKALYAALTGDATLTGLVGTRIYPVIIPQETTMPAIRYTRISTASVSALTGDSGMEDARMQIDVIAESVSSARSVAEAVRGAIKRMRGTYASTDVRDVFLEDESGPDWDQETRRYRITADYIMTIVV